MRLRVAKKIRRLWNESGDLVRVRGGSYERALRHLLRAHRRGSALLHYTREPLPSVFMGHFIVDEGGLNRPRDLTHWGLWLEIPSNRRIRASWVGPIWVSTVFLALDHGFGRGKPVLWETMTFLPGSSGRRARTVDDQAGLEEVVGLQSRYTSRADAIKGHEAMVAEVRAFLDRRAVA